METDADRLAMIKSLGGQLVRHDGGEFWAVFENEFAAASFDVEVEAARPTLAARTSDVQQIRKGAVLRLHDFAGREVTYYIDKHEPDGSGITRILLSG